MKNKILLTCIILFYAIIARGQVNSPVFNVDIDYNLTNSLGPILPANRVSVDYVSEHPNPSQWAVVSVSDIQYSNSLSCVVSVSTPTSPVNDYYALSKPGKIYSPDVIVYDITAYVIYITAGASPSLNIDFLPDIRPTGVGGAGTPATNIYSLPITLPTGFTPTCNLDANLQGDFAMCYSDGISSAYFFQGNFNTTVFSPTITWNNFSAPSSVNYETPDVAVDYLTGDAYAVTANTNNGSLDFYILSSNFIVKNWTSRQYDYTVPRIAAAPSSNYSVPFGVVAMNTNHDVELVYLDPTLKTFNYNEITSGNSGLGISGYPDSLILDSFSYNPVITYNKASCGTISVIWNNRGPIDQVIGVDIKASTTDPFPYSDLDDFYGVQSGNHLWYLPVSQNTSCEDAVAICGRFADTKAAAFVTRGSANENIYHHHWDCVGAWRPINPAEEVLHKKDDKMSAVIIYPSISDEIITISNLKAGTNYNLEVYSNIGILVKSLIIQNQEGSAVLDLKSLNDGLYYLKIKDSKNGSLLSTQKFVMQH
jgi:hypothetical protein